MKYIVDMQGFKQPGNDFVLKGLAIVPFEEDAQPLTFLFEEPFPWKRLTDKYKGENTWLKQFYHGISWNSGDRLYTDIRTVLRACLHDTTQVLVTGPMKKTWLERFRFNVRDVTEMGFPPLDNIKLVTVCPNHEGADKTSCALYNIKLLEKFYDNCASETTVVWE